jgi:hypothetical protein
MPRPSADERATPLVKEKKTLDRVHDRFTYAVDRWGKIRRARQEDMRHVSGDPWEPKEKRARQDAMRPVPACDEIGQYLNQVTNEVEVNPRAMRFSPVGFGANDKTAQFYADKAREIEYRSKAQQHYAKAFQNMVEGSYGYVKVKTEFVTDRPAGPQDAWSAFDRRMVIEGVPDPDCVYPDPDFLDRTGRDWDWLFEIESVSRRDFKRAYPKAEIQNFSPELVKYAKGWISGTGETQKLQIASYWEVDRSAKRMIEAWNITNPENGGAEVYELYSDDPLLKKAAKFGKKIDEREVDDPTVWQYRTNGVEILKKTKWITKSIPYAAFFGKMIWLDLGSGPELMIFSMTRLARAPNMLLAYYLACEAEMIGMTPKVPWWVWKGSLDPKNAKKVQRANHEPVAFIEVDVTMNQAGGNGQPTPSLPQRLPFEPPIQAIEIAKESAKRSIQAAMGLTPLPTSMQRDNPKLSGRAMDKFRDAGQLGSYHFMASYNGGIERIGEIIEEGIPVIHDRAGETPVLDNQKRPQNIFINANKLPEGAERPEDALPSVDGLHAVTIDVGPADASARQQSSDFVDTFVQAPFFQMLPPPMALQILSLLVKLKNLGPIGEEIADLLHPPEQEGQEQMVPAAKLQEAVQMGEQVIQALQAKITEYEKEREAKVIETEGKLAIQAQGDKTKTTIAELQAEVTMQVAELKSETELKIQRMEEMLEMLKLREQGQQAEADREAGVMTAGAELEQKTAVSERQGQRQQQEGRESRTLQAREGEANRGEARQARASADRNAAEDRKIKAQQATKPKGAK